MPPPVVILVLRLSDAVFDDVVGSIFGIAVMVVVVLLVIAAVSHKKSRE